MVLYISLPFQAIRLSKASLSPRRNSIITDDWIMKKVVMAAVSPIKAHSLSSLQPYHYRGYRYTVRSEKQIKMVWNQHPGGTRCGSICQMVTELITEGFSIDIIPKNISVLNCPVYDAGLQGYLCGLGRVGAYCTDITDAEKGRPSFHDRPFSSIETFGRRTTFKIH